VPGDKRASRNWPLRIAIGLSLIYVYSAFIPFEFRPDWWRLDVIKVLLIRRPFADRPPGHWGLTFSLSNSIVNSSAGFLLGWFACVGLRRLTGRLWLAVPLGVLLAVATAVAMEVVQVGVVGRVPTPTDICAISFGGAVGVVLAALFGGSVWTVFWRWIAEPLLQRRAGLTLTLLVLSLCVRSLFPTNIAASYGELLQNAKRVNILPFRKPGLHLAVQLRQLGFDIDDRPYRDQRFWRELTPVRYGFNLVGHAIAFLAIATALSAVLNGSWLRDTIAAGLLTGSLAFAIEALQVFLPSQCADVNVVLIGFGAGVLGPTVWRILSVHDVLPPLAGAVACLGYSVTQYLKPGLGAGTRGVTLWDMVPIYHMERSSHRVGLLLNIFECFAPFVFLGWACAALAARRFSSRSTALVAILICFAVAMGLETAQGWVHRVPSIDGVLFAVVGGACGVWLQRRTTQFSEVEGVVTARALEPRVVRC